MKNEIKNLSGEVIFTYDGMDLRNANLIGAYLKDANLEEAYLTEADFEKNDDNDD